MLAALVSLYPTRGTRLKEQEKGTVNLGGLKYKTIFKIDLQTITSSNRGKQDELVLLDFEAIVTAMMDIDQASTVLPWKI